jgi:NAD-dependent DNA ligase
MTNIIVDKTEEFKTPQVTSDSIVLFCQGFAEFIQSYNLIQNSVTNIELPTMELLLKIITENESSGEGGASEGAKKSIKGNIVFSGVRDKEKEKYFVNHGYEISDSVNSNTKLLIVKDKNAQTTKIKKAKNLGVEIVSLSEL